MSDDRLPRIVLAMIEAGGGHKSTAYAIAEAFERRYPGRAQVSIPDFGIEIGATDFDLKHKKQWDSMLSHPVLTRVGYEIQDMLGPLSRWYVRQWARPYFEAAERWFLRTRPEIFMPTHWLNAAAAAWVKQRNPELPTKHLYFLCEPLDSSAIHHWKGADAYVVGSHRVEYRLIEAGIERWRIHRAGYPVRLSFFEKHAARSDICAQLKLDPDRIIVLMSAGASGLGRMGSLAEALYKANLRINLIVVCGKNQILKDRLVALQSDGAKTKLAALGYTAQMPELVSICDVAAVKAGPASIFEAVYSGKPVVVFEHVARHEKANAEYIVSNKAGWYTPSAGKLVSLIREILSDPSILRKASEATSAVDIHNAAEPIADYLAAELSRLKT